MAARVPRKISHPGSVGVGHVRFFIRAENCGHVLPRVVLLSYSLNVEIALLHLVRRHGSETMSMNVTVEADQERAKRMEVQLYKVTQVRSVKAEFCGPTVLGSETVGHSR
jgi:hypothetical protein